MDGLTSGWLDRAIAEGGTGNAEVVRDLEAALAGLTGATYALCVSSGTTALMSALWAVGVRPGDLVAVSVLGPAMTGLAVTAMGARPRFLDCGSPMSFGVSADGAAGAVRDGVKAALLVPMWGYWDETPDTLTVFRESGVPVIVDAAQAPFLRLSQGLFTVADVVCLSLHGRKPIKAGEGGACLTARANLAEQIVAVRNFGQKAAFTGTRVDPVGPFASRPGTNFKINALGAAWCLGQLADITALRTRLDGLRQLATDAFTQTGACWSETTQSPDVIEHGRYGLVAICPTPAEATTLAGSLTQAGAEVDTSRYRYAPMTATPRFAQFTVPCPNAARLAPTAVACRLEAFARTTAGVTP